MITLPALVSSFIAAMSFRALSRDSVRTDALSVDLRAVGETAYDVAARQLTRAVAEIPGESPALYEALITAWREATGAAPSGDYSELCKGIVAGALLSRAMLYGAPVAVDAVSTEKPRGDA